MNRPLPTLDDDYRRLGGLLADTLGGIAIDGLYLPAAVPDETFRDEFGFVLLDDGSVGPFYVSLDDLLQRLWQRYPVPGDFTARPHELLAGFASDDPLPRALAVGIYNALSAALFRGAGYLPPARAADSGLPRLGAGARVGMVGYFCPLIDRLVAQGCEVVILELAPQRVSGRDDVSIARSPGELGNCEHVLCTASTLVNGSLGMILAAVGDRAPIELIGPSGSGLPEPLLARGVQSVGGVGFTDRAQLLAQLKRGRSWGEAGRKYQLDAASYPGVDTLLANYRAHAGQP